VVILPMGPPTADGQAVARWLRADPATAHCWIIGVGGDEHRGAALSAGCDQLVGRPLRIDDVALALRAGQGRNRHLDQEDVHGELGAPAASVCRRTDVGSTGRP
jgi:DNA-binding response OmpR family regulator